MTQEEKGGVNRTRGNREKTEELNGIGSESEDMIIESVLDFWVNSRSGNISANACYKNQP